MTKQRWHFWNTRKTDPIRGEGSTRSFKQLAPRNVPFALFWNTRKTDPVRGEGTTRPFNHQAPRNVAFALLTTTVAFGVGFASALMSAPPERFDYKVRNDFFAGLQGDGQALERAMNTAEDVLAGNPKHAEALVWHGAGLYFRAGAFFRKSDFQNGMRLYQKAMEEMDRAVELEPDNLGVRIPRGASLLEATRFQPFDQRVAGEIRKAIGDFRHTYELQKDHLEKLGEHPLGQLLLGLGDGYSRLGERENALVFFNMIEEKLPQTAYAKRASAWKQNGSLTPEQGRCIGCHVR